MANKKYTSISNDYNLMFNLATEVKEINEDSRIAEAAFTFTGLHDIEKIIQQQTIDVIGVILEI